MKLKTVLLPVILCLITVNVSAQIVNMESQRYHTDTTGWKGSISGNLALTNYGEKVFAVNANAHIQYQSKKSLYLLLGSYGFLKGGDESFIDNGFLHFRYNFKLTKVVRLEAFTQLQQNAITKIQSRFLIGAGPRFKIVGSKKLKLYAGVLAVYEIQKETDVPEEKRYWRSSNYLSLSFIPNAQTELVTTTYYQPVFNDFSNYRLLNQSVFKIRAGKKVFVNLNWNYQFDAVPAAGVPRETYSFSTGIELSL
ncbi:MAG: DUF481 domain-containing protein [Bacteroidota bacterium]